MLVGSFKCPVIAIVSAVLVVVINARSQGACTTQLKEVGLCVPISKCEATMQLIAAAKSAELLPSTVVETVRRSCCGTFDGVSHVCCKQNNVSIEIAPTTTRINNDDRSKGTCRTVNLGVGVCVPILTCGTTIELLQKSPIPLPAFVVQAVRQSHCGTFGDVHHVCCLPNNVTREEASTPKYTTDMTAVVSNAGSETESQAPCTTLRNETGVCVLIRDCETVLQLLQISARSEGPLPLLSSEIVRQSHCGTYNNASEVRVCCKLNRVTSGAKPTLKISKEGPIEDSAATCRTVFNTTGVCVPMLTCRTITTILQASESPAPLPNWVIQTVKQSHCGTIGNVHNVCCKPNEVATNITGIRPGFESSAESRSSCRTVRGEVGVCVPMLTCEAITELLQTSSGSSPLSPLAIDIVARSHCGTFSDVHHVCCKRRYTNRTAAPTRRNPPRRVL